MVSRRKILNRSRDDLNVDQEEEDIWYQKDKLFKVSLIRIHFLFAFLHLPRSWWSSSHICAPETAFSRDTIFE
jgi:hypothetical protein